MSLNGATRQDRPLVELEGVTVEFKVAARNLRATTRLLRAVDRVTLTVERGETLALVGESGGGKTTLGRTMIRLCEPTDGRILFDGTDLATLSRSALRAFRRRAQMIFQDPYASLNPRMKVSDIVAEPLRAQGMRDRDERQARVQQLLNLVGLPRDAAWRFPHAFSGGQRQRIGIARALALDPELLVADEPVSALDVSIQAQVLNLLLDIQDELGLTLVFIAHDLAVVRHIASRVAVMYLGAIVEAGTRDEVFGDPRHPYTRSLLSAVPLPDPVAERSRERHVLKGDVPSPMNLPSGCRFHTRCPVALPECSTVEPSLLPLARGRSVACHLVHRATLDTRGARGS